MEELDEPKKTSKGKMGNLRKESHKTPGYATMGINVRCRR